MPLPAPKAPSSIIKISRWALLSCGIYYGYNRREELKKIEDARRAREERERPAKECAMAAELARKSEEEMDYLAQQAGAGKYAKKEACLCPSSVPIGKTYRRREAPPPWGPYTLPGAEPTVPTSESTVPTGEFTDGDSTIPSGGSSVPNAVSAASSSDQSPVPSGESTVPSDQSTPPCV